MTRRFSDKTTAIAWMAGTLAFFLIIFWVFSISPARADQSTQLATARDMRDSCQLLANNSTGTQRTRAQQCVTDQQRIIQLLTQHPTSAPVTPTSLPSATSPPTPQPSSSSAPTGQACPALPAVPDANCTGVPPGTVLHDCPNGIKGGVWDGCLFRGTLVVRGVGTVIKNSLILGNVDAGDAGNCSQQSGLQIIDSEIDGSSTSWDWNAQLVGFNCFSLLRVDGHGTGYGVNASGTVTITDSYLHDWETFNGSDHKDAVISNGGSNISIIHNNLQCNYSGGGDGLCSAAVGLFGDFAAVTNVEISRNLFNSVDGFCIYGGNTDGKPYPDASNVKITDNLFGKKYHDKCGFYGPSTDVELARGNTWSGNRWQDGSGIVNPG